MWQVAHDGAHIGVDVVGAAHYLPLVGFGSPPLAHLARCQYGNGFGWPYAFVLAQFGNGLAAEQCETSVAVAQNALHQCYGILVCIARPYEYGQ